MKRLTSLIYQLFQFACPALGCGHVIITERKSGFELQGKTKGAVIIEVYAERLKFLRQL